MFDVSTEVPELGELRLAEVLTRDDSVLQKAIQRLLSESDAHDIVAGFNSAM